MRTVGYDGRRGIVELVRQDQESQKEVAGKSNACGSTQNKNHVGAHDEAKTHAAMGLQEFSIFKLD